MSVVRAAYVASFPSGPDEMWQERRAEMGQGSRPTSQSMGSRTHSDAGPREWAGNRHAQPDEHSTRFQLNCSNSAHDNLEPQARRPPGAFGPPDSHGRLPLLQFEAMRKENKRMQIEVHKLRENLSRVRASRLCIPFVVCERQHPICCALASKGMQTRHDSHGSSVLIEDYEADIKTLREEVGTLKAEVRRPMEATAACRMLHVSYTLRCAGCPRMLYVKTNQRFEYNILCFTRCS
jgi:hypothetical protein